MAGIKLEKIEETGGGLDGVVVGRVVGLEPCPQQADLPHRLFVAAVEAGEEDTLTVVTGAGNVSLGDLVPLARPGSRLPDGRVIGAEGIRGVLSEGMMCSERDLGLGDDASGIMILPERLETGRSVALALDLSDWVLEFEIYPNRPDCLSIRGIAREVAALLELPLRAATDSARSWLGIGDSPARVEISDPELCPRYSAVLIEDVTIAPSPLWMRLRLQAAGVRPINNVVDVTNYVMLETGQPLHAFDYDTLQGRRIVVRKALPGERIRTIDGALRGLGADMLVIADEKRPVAVAGVMGGQSTAVNDRTKRILIESAHFSPVSVRLTSRQLGLRSEASSRFEKGVDPEGTLAAAERTAALVLQCSGGRPLGRAVDLYPLRPPERRLSMRPSRIRALIGFDVGDAEMKGYLSRLGMSVTQADSAWVVEVPSFRRDIEEEADLAEEVARLYGYDRIPSTLPHTACQAPSGDSLLCFVDLVRRALTACGLNEAISYSFVGPRGGEVRGFLDHGPEVRAVRIQNPLTVDHSLLRTSLFPSLLDILARNRSRRVERVAVFEIGTVYIAKSRPLESLPDEKRLLGIALMGPAFRRSWLAHDREVDFFDLKGLVEGILERFAIPGSFRPGVRESLHPGRTAVLQVGAGEAAGIFGEVSPGLLEAYDLRARAFVGEFDLSVLFRHADLGRGYTPLARHPASARDIAVVVPEEVPAEAVREAILECAGHLAREVVLFDMYRGPQVTPGYRSLAYSVTYQAADRTLTDQEVMEVHKGIERFLEERFGAKPRAV